MKHTAAPTIPRGAVLHRERRPIRGAKGFIEHVSEVEWVETAATHDKHRRADAVRVAEELARLREQLATVKKQRDDLGHVLESLVDRLDGSEDRATRAFEQLTELAAANERDDAAATEARCVLPPPREGELAVDYLGALRDFEHREGAHCWRTGARTTESSD